MRFLTYSLFVLVSFTGMMSLPADEAAVKEASFDCGLNAAYIYLNRAGHHVAYDELVRDFLGQTPPDSLLAIRNVLAMHGCRTVAVQSDPAFLLEQSGPAIVYLELDGYSLNGERHFSYMVRASKRDGVAFLDPLFEVNRASVMTWDTFTRIFKGIALVAHE